MAKRREPGQREYNPLDDARGRLPIDDELIRAVISDPAPAPPPAPATYAEEVRPIPAPAPAHAEPPASLREDSPAGQGITLEKLTAYNKFLTTHTEKFELDRFAARVSGALGASVKPSQLLRACLVLLLGAESEVICRAEKQPRVKRPSNTEAAALVEFDQILAEILSQAFRDAGPVKARQ